LKSYSEIASDLGGLVSKSAAQRYMTELFPAMAARMNAEHSTTPVAEGGLRNNLPPPLAAREELLQGVREAVAAALDESPEDHDLRADLVAILRAILAELEPPAAQTTTAEQPAMRGHLTVVDGGGGS
jgi:hypothetical protein